MRLLLVLAWVMCVLACGCGNEPASAKKASPVKAASDGVPDTPPPQTEPPLEDEPETAGTTESTGVAESQELTLKESGMTFAVPAGWKRVKPGTNIIEAEFQLPGAEGDESDARLTLMSSLGDRDEMIGRRISEFKAEPGESPTRETMTIGGIESTIVDLRGEWSGADFQQIKPPPREGYRMLYVLVPFGEKSSFYAKLVGPRATVAAHEDEFREFLKSAKISR